MDLELTVKVAIVTGGSRGTTGTEKTPGVFAAQAAQHGITVEESERRLGQNNSIRRTVDAQEVA